MKIARWRDEFTQNLRTYLSVPPLDRNRELMKIFYFAMDLEFELAGDPSTIVKELREPAWPTFIVLQLHFW